MKIIESYQVPEGNVSPDIFALPCVECVNKKYDRTIEYGVFLRDTGLSHYMEYACPTDWICKDSDGKWHVLSDDEYHKFNPHKIVGVKIEQQ
jgi:hypothetical protein